jgi:F0F1-type ATP synthase delta subunit
MRLFSSRPEIESAEGDKAPIREDSLPGRYATVLFQQASKKKLLFRVLEDVEWLKSFAKTNEKFNLFITNACISMKGFREVQHEL